MSRHSFLCPKCSKPYCRISMSGGSVVQQGLPVPDPDDFCITLHPCHCVSSVHDADFPAFVNVWRQAYNIPEFRPANTSVAMPSFVSVAAASVKAPLR
jgi:hypothetical protein